MPVQLVQTAEQGTTIAHDRWCTIDAPAKALSPAKAIPSPMAILESILPEAIEHWREVSRDMAREPTANYSHTPACAMNISDFGIMLAWSILVERWASEPQTTLVVCPDPWLFRHLADQDGVMATPSPPIWPIAWKLMLRGYLARTRAAARMLVDHIALASSRRVFPGGSPTLLVYGHPESTSAGHDGYFGDLLTTHQQASRVLHVDCPGHRAKDLSQEGRTFSLHAWGRWSVALRLPWARWRPSRRLRENRWGWLIKRAATREGGTGQGAMLRWQICCQERWLRATKPDIVIWPWENHSWERQLVRTARTEGCRTVGYQHATIGRWEANYRPATEENMDDSTPDQIFACGKVTAEVLQRWGYPATRIKIAGAFRFDATPSVEFNAKAPVFVALPFDLAVAEDLLSAVRNLAHRGYTIRVKDHPMTPFPFNDEPRLERTLTPLGEQRSLSAVIYSGTTVGLEALLAGLPTIRYQPTAKIAPEILPDGIEIPTAGSDDLADALAKLAPPTVVNGSDIFAPPDEQLWRSTLNCEPSCSFAGT